MKTQVLTVGAGRVGLTLALDLGRRGVRCILVETERGTAIPAENGALQRPHHGVVPADPGVLDSYEIERRQAGERNVGASRHAAMGCRSWRKLCGREIYENSSQDAAARGRLAAVADVQQRKINEMAGAELGCRYADSSIVDGVPGGPEYLFQNTGPAWPDAGLPYLWLSDGTPVQDRVPLFGFTLLRLTDRAESPPVEAAFRARGVPLQVVLIQGDTTRSVYGRDPVLVRPDLHVVWRGDQPPDDPSRLVAIAAGFGEGPIHRPS